MQTAILALDQGTTSSRAIVFDHAGAIRAAAQQEFKQIYPQAGWVEHDPLEIWQTQLATAREALTKAGLKPGDIAAIGITNQRETTVVWDRQTGAPIHNAIVWQDRRTARFCDELKRAGHAELIQCKSGLVIDAYFSGSKLRWILDHVPAARERARRGELAFGTIDTWLLWNLTAGALHVTDPSNASRTMLFNLHTGAWDDELLRVLDVPREVLPQVRSSSEVYGETAGGVFDAPIRIGGIAGDQQAALFGQNCFSRGLAKNTYGTGCFMLMNIGPKPAPSKHQLITTVAWQANEKTDFALEGSVFIGGAVVQWLRDGLGLIKSSADIEKLAASVPDCGGVYLVPAFAGLGAPHWDQYARGTMTGITRGTTAAHIARAALEGIAFQVADILDVMKQDSGIAMNELRVDGGACANNLLMQFQADLLQVPVVRPKVTETTALGAAYLAGLAAGFWKNREEVHRAWQADRTFGPQMSADEAAHRRRRWAEALKRARDWEEHSSVKNYAGHLTPMQRAAFLRRILERREPWDLAVVGGGATGVGIAVDAASRGYSVVLLEQSDFGKGTSSRSTKLVHGGVRYLQQGNISLVMEALKERGLLLQNAPHLVHDLQFVVPNYAWWEAPFYGIGLKVYDMLAGRYGFGTSKVLSREEVLARIPTLEQDGLRGGVLYHDGQFDDSRLLINLAQTAAEQGACLLNYARATGLLKDAEGFTTGLNFRDEETGQEHRLAARCVINATGPFCDELRRFDDLDAPPMIAPSQGVHIVLRRDFLPRDTAIMVPHTRDGRVMFAIPWHDHVVVGTTDTPIPTVSLEPAPLAHEVDFILETASGYLARRPARADILSVFTGIRPLVKAGDTSSTAALSRDHTIQISKSGLLTITGGKWTTYRKMAEDCVEHAVVLARLAERPCVTKDLHVHGFHRRAEQFGALASYGSDAVGLGELMREQSGLAKPLHEALPICGAQVVWAVRHEMARTVDDVLARRTRALYLNTRAALAMAPAVARLLAAELHRDEAWQQRQLAEFADIASRFAVNP